MNGRHFLISLLLIIVIAGCSDKPTQSTDVSNDASTSSGSGDKVAATASETITNKPLVNKKDVVKFISDIKSPKEGMGLSFLDYYPLGKGVSYVMADGNLDSWFDSFDIGTSTIDGKKSYARSTSPITSFLSKVGDPNSNLYLVNKNDNAISNIGTKSASGKVSWRKNPNIEYPLVFKIGQEYSFEDPDSKEIGILDNTKLVFKGFVDLIISDVHFQDCLIIDKVHTIEIPNKNKTTITSHEYYAKGLGLVYYEHDFLWEDYVKKEKSVDHAFTYYVESGQPTSKTFKLK